MRSNKHPFPSVNFPKQVQEAMVDADIASQIFTYNKTGNITSDFSGEPIGTVLENGLITDFLVAVGNCGRDDTDALQLSANLKLNGTTVLSGEVEIDGVSGEAGSASFGTVPEFDTTAVVRGDLLTLDVTLTRTTPDTEIADLFTSVKIVPLT